MNGYLTEIDLDEASVNVGARNERDPVSLDLHREFLRSSRLDGHAA
jgi:hypothetical protein